MRQIRASPSAGSSLTAGEVSNYSPSDRSTPAKIGFSVARRPFPAPWRQLKPNDPVVCDVATNRPDLAQIRHWRCTQKTFDRGAVFDGLLGINYVSAGCDDNGAALG
jgi:hypothetical protein